VLLVERREGRQHLLETRPLNGTQGVDDSVAVRDELGEVSRRHGQRLVPCDHDLASAIAGILAARDVTSCF
jgi:hypothetical protein